MTRSRCLQVSFGLLWPLTSGLPATTPGQVPPPAVDPFPEMGRATGELMKHNPAIIQLVCHSWWRPPIRRLSPTHTDACRVPTSPSLDAFSNGEDGLALGSGLHRQPLSVSSSTGTLASGLGDSGRLCGPGSVRPSRSSDKSPVGDTMRSLVTRSYWSPEDHRLLACSDG